MASAAAARAAASSYCSSRRSVAASLISEPAVARVAGVAGVTGMTRDSSVAAAGWARAEPKGSAVAIGAVRAIRAMRQEATETKAAVLEETNARETFLTRIVRPPAPEEQVGEGALHPPPADHGFSVFAYR